jgi:hypothetical protein
LFCINCGAGNSDEIAFCVACGTKLKAPQRDTTAVVPPPVEARSPVVNTQERKAPQPPAKTKGGAARSNGLSIAVAVVIVAAIGVAGFVFLSGSSKNESVATTVLQTTIAPVQTTVVVSTSLVRVPLGLGDVNQSCQGSSLVFDDASGELNFSSTNSDVFVVDRWVVNSIRLLALDCDNTTVVMSIDVSGNALRVVDYESQYDVLFTKFGPRVLRFGVDGLCCFPSAPLSSAKLLRITNNGTISIEESNISRFPGWNPIKSNCDEFTPVDYYPSESVSGSSYGSSPGYVTVCSEGTAVKNLQSVLINRGYDIYADGYFGPATLNALSKEAKNSGYTNVHGAIYWEGEYLYARTVTSSLYVDE